MTSCLDKTTSLVIIPSILECCILSHNSGLCQGAQSVNALLSYSYAQIPLLPKFAESTSTKLTSQCKCTACT